MVGPEVVLFVFINFDDIDCLVRGLISCIEYALMFIIKQAPNKSTNAKGNKPRRHRASCIFLARTTNMN